MDLECSICLLLLWPSSSDPDDCKTTTNHKENVKKKWSSMVKRTPVKNNSSTLCCTPCGHVFHRACVTRWLSKRLECPICRADRMFTYSLYPLYLSVEESSCSQESSENGLRRREQGCCITSFFRRIFTRPPSMSPSS